MEVIPQPSADTASALLPTARKRRAEVRLTQLWEAKKLPPPGDPIFAEIERELGFTEARVRELHAETRRVTKGLSGLCIRTPTGSGRNR